MANYISVTNVNGSGRYSAPAGYSSWLDYWEKQTGKKVIVCGVSGCNNTDLVGAHVQKAYGLDKKWYVTPICRSCNAKSSSEVFQVCWDLVPVPSNL